MKTLHITIRDKIATYMKRDGEIVCGNSDYQIEFDFDNEWDAYADKTARFIWNGQHFDQPFSGNICRVPVIKNTTSCLVGVYVEDLETTTPAQIDCLKSVLCNNTTRYSESDVIYADEAQEAAKRAEDAAERAEDSLERAEEIVDSLEDGSYIESDPTVPAWAKKPNPPTPAEIGAAPAGFGLGTQCVAPPNYSLDDAVANGWYVCGPNYPGAPTGHINIEYGTVFVFNRDGDITQDYCCDPVVNGAPLKLVRRKTANEWSEWEWVNPPMELGVEYRTTERMSGKPVYKKNDNGVIKYRLDGETEWKNYAPVYGAAPAGYGEGTKQDGEKGYFIAGDSIGWYRIATARSHRFSALVSLWHEYSTGGSSDDLWYVSGVNMAQCLRCLGYSASIPALVDNIRVVNTGGYNVAVDVYCRLNAKNGWSINIINTGIGYTTNTDQSRLRLQTPVFIGADDTLPEGETLIQTMEWANPPMQLGVEYRTTERYKGKPLYVKAVDCGELPVSTNKVIEYGDSQCRALFCYGECGGTTIPTMNFGSYLDPTFPSASIISLWGNANTLCIACGGDRSGVSTTVIVKYWKTTD